MKLLQARAERAVKDDRKDWPEFSEHSCYSCHRIVGANGSLTGYGGGLHVKRALLELEGAMLPS